MVRSRLAQGPVVSAMRQALLRLDQQQPLVRSAALDEVLSDRLDRSLFYTILLSCFATVSLLLSAVGLYGVLTLLILQRRREFGIRLCLGATPRNIVGLVLRHALRLLAIGSVIGVALTVLSARLLSVLLYGVAPVDPLILVLCVLGVFVVAIVAGWAPVRSVVRLQPAFITGSE
jgi:ABC-type antimicrobial peptide transport system permease subunit